jgi:hypothetical protein
MNYYTPETHECLDNQMNQCSIVTNYVCSRLWNKCKYCKLDEDGCCIYMGYTGECRNSEARCDQKEHEHERKIYVP